MNNAGDAAEQIVRMSLEGVEVAAKISGEGAERIAKILISAFKDNKNSRGKASLSKMLRSNKPIKVFSLKDNELKKFCQEAKKYGVLYHILKDKDENDGRCDIMVRAEDASKVNRIFERFHLGANNQATIKQAIEKAKSEKRKAPEHKRPEKSEEDKFIDELFSKPLQKEKTTAENPTAAKTEKSRPSEHSSERSAHRRTERARSTTSRSERPSVRKELSDIKRELRSQDKGTKNKSPKTKTPKIPKKER